MICYTDCETDNLEVVEWLDWDTVLVWCSVCEHEQEMDVDEAVDLGLIP